MFGAGGGLEAFRLFGNVFIKDEEANRALDNLDKKAASVGERLGKLGDGMVKVGDKLTKFVTLPLLAIGTGLANAAMNLEATEAKYNTVFAGMTDRADAFIEKFQELTPATTTAARNMASGIQDLLVPMGYARDMATDMTGEFMHAIGALTNFNSATHTSDMVATAMQAAITGEYQALKALGIQLDATTMEQKAFEMGLISNKDEMNKKIAAQVLLSEVYKQSTDALAAYNEESLDNKTKMLLAKAEILDVAAAIGSHLLPFIGKATDFVRNLTEKFANLDEGQQKTILMILGIAAAIGPALIVIGKIITAVGAIAGVVTGPIIIIVAAIGAFVAAIVHAWRTSEEFRDKVTAVFKKAQEATQEIFGKIREAIGGAMGDSEFSFSSFMDTVIEVLIMIVDYISWFIDVGLAIWDKYGTQIVTLAVGAWNMITDIFGGAFKIIHGLFEFFAGLFTGDWERMGEGIVKIWEGLWQAVTGILKQAWNVVKTLFDVWVTQARKAFEQSRDAASKAAGQLKDWVIGKLTDLVKWIVGLPAKSTKWGRDIIQNLWNGMKEIYNNLKTWFENNVQKLLDKLNPWAKHSPSLIDNIRSGVREIERAYAGIRLPDYNVQGAAGPLAAIGAGSGASGFGGGSGVNVTHSGTITVKGVNDYGETVAIIPVLIDAIKNDPQVQRALGEAGHRQITDRSRPQGGSSLVFGGAY